jgi:putative endonuclease
VSFLAALFAPRRLPVKQLGAMGERRAAWFYRLRGYRIIARNAHVAGGEVDLVVRRGRTIVIAEVKTRQTHAAGEGSEAVDRKKSEQMLRIGDHYAAKHPEARLRYDVLSIRWTGRRFVVTHYPHALEPVADANRPWIWRV